MIKNKNLLLRYKTFINNYINNGFNATQAYKDTYKVTEQHSAETCGSRLLSNVTVIKLLCEELRRKELDINEEYIIQKVLSIVNDKKCQKRDILRGLELLSRIKGYLKPDIQQNVAVFNEAKVQEDKILKKRFTDEGVNVVE